MRLPATPDTIGAHLRAWQGAGQLDLPLPAGGETRERWRALAELSSQDLSLGRLVEAHADAVAILAELSGPPAGGSLWGVWASEPPGEPLRATRVGDRWQLDGAKAWCSGSTLLDRALVTARDGQDRRLFALDVADVSPRPGTWSSVGMAATGSLTVDLDAVTAEPVGGPDDYLTRPGFWHGAAGVAASWHGGALGAARLLREHCRRRPGEVHALAHLGAVDALVTGVDAHLDVAAQRIDEGTGQPRADAMRVRAHVEAVATEVLDRVGRATGAGPLCADPVHAQRAADLPVYLRQSHGERDLAELGGLAVERSTW